jgi:multiple sugar transport system permease protein
VLRDSEKRELALMLAPYLLGIALLIAVPAAVTFGLALTEYDLIRSARFLGLENFGELWNDEVFRLSLRNSLMFILFAVPMRLCGALALALLLHKRFRGVAAYRTAGYLPTVVPDVAYALLWLWIFNPLYGPLNLALASLGAPTPSWLTNERAAQWAVIIMSLFLIGEGFIVAMATRQGIPGELYDLGEIERASPFFMFSRVTLPLMAPTLLLLMFRDTIFSFQATFVPALLVTEGGPPPYATTYLPLFIYRTGFEYLRYGYAAAATVIMFAITALIVYLQYRIIRRWRHAFVV